MIYIFTLYVCKQTFAEHCLTLAGVGGSDAVQTPHSRQEGVKEQPWDGAALPCTPVTDARFGGDAYQGEAQLRGPQPWEGIRPLPLSSQRGAQLLSGSCTQRVQYDGGTGGLVLGSTAVSLVFRLCCRTPRLEMGSIINSLV